MRVRGRWVAVPLGRIIRLVVLVLLVVGVLWALSFYMSDGVVEADVKEKQCSPVGESSLTVKTRWFGIEQTKGLGYMECTGVPVGAYVQYHVKSGRTVVFDRQGGHCLFDNTGEVC